MLNEDYFGRMAEQYDSLYKGTVAEAENRSVLGVIAQVNDLGRSVLDLGCGTGLMFERQREYTDHLNDYVGIDLSSQMIDQFQAKLSKKYNLAKPLITKNPTRLIVGDTNTFEDYLEKDRQFDLCLSTFGSFSYVDDLTKGFRTTFDRLEPRGGAAVLMFYGPRAYGAKMPSSQRVWGKYSFRNSDELSHSAYFYNEESLRNYLAEAGIQDYNIYGLNHHPDLDFMGLSVSEISSILDKDMGTRAVDEAHSIIVTFRRNE